MHYNLFLFSAEKRKEGRTKIKTAEKREIVEKNPRFGGGGGQKEFPPQPFEGERFLSASTARAEGTGLSDGRYRIRRFSKCLFRMFYLWEGERGENGKRGVPEANPGSIGRREGFDSCVFRPRLFPPPLFLSPHSFLPHISYIWGAKREEGKGVSQ